MRKIVSLALVAGVVGILLPAGAQAKTQKVRSSIDADIVGLIDRHGAIQYAFGGEIGAKNFTFKCMEGRTVRLFKLDPTGAATQVGSTKSEFFGAFTGNLELPLNQVVGYYYADAPARNVKWRGGKLHCLAARTPNFLVEVPASLLG